MSSLRWICSGRCSSRSWANSCRWLRPDHTVERLTALFGGHLPSPVELLAVEPGDLRAAGLSWRKVNTLRDLAQRLTDGRLDAQRLSQLADDDFITELTAVPGIGPWTAQGALLVALRREDVVLPGDLALRKAVPPPITMTTCPVRTRSSKSRRSGARTAALPRPIYSPPRTNRATPRQRRDNPPGSPARPAVAGVLPGDADRVRGHAAHRARSLRATPRSQRGAAPLERGRRQRRKITSTQPSTTGLTWSTNSFARPFTRTPLISFS